MTPRDTGQTLSGPHDKRRKRRSRPRIGQLDAQIVAVLTDDRPQSVRHIFYRMTDPRLPEPVEKSDRGYRHVQERLKQLRLTGRVPYGWITDATRRGHHVHTYSDSADFIRRVHSLYRADLWRTSQHYVEVWTESRSIAGVVEADCRDLAVSLYPAGGFTSMTLAYEAAECMAAHIENDRKAATILYVGDYDPAGVLIDRDIETKLRGHLGALGNNLTFRRIGITPEQIADYDLPTKPRKTADLRSLHISETVEAEAMPAAIMRQLLRDEIEMLLPAGALKVAKAAEESERGYLLTLANAVGTSRGAA